MILTIALSHIYVEIKNLALKQLCSEITQKFWSEWELRLMVIVSLILQLVLVKAGNVRQRFQGKNLPYVAMGVWFVYLSADWMATLTLSTLLRGDVHLKNDLVVFWTPFLLWHLGKPHNITAYSLEDNEIWLRHFLAMFFLVLEAIYIYVRLRSNTVLNALGLPIFIAGVFKYAERIWALRSANYSQLLTSLYDRDSSVQWKHRIRVGLLKSTITKSFEGKGSVPELNLLRRAYSSFIVLKPFLLGLPFRLSENFYKDEIAFNIKNEAEQSFKQIGVELGYLYDMLFTKMPLHHRYPKLSWLLRAICLLSTVSTLITFTAMVEKSLHSKVDIVVTYLLLLGAICLDLYTIKMHILSIWAVIMLPIPDTKVLKLYSDIIASRVPCIEAKIGIKLMGQHDLIEYYVKTKTNKFRAAAVKIMGPSNFSQKYRHSYWKIVDRDLKKFIYEHLEKKHKKWEDMVSRSKNPEKLLNGKIGNIDLRSELLPKELELELDEETTDFTQRIFLWHFATKLVYYDDIDNFRNGALGSYQIALSLCDYMMYLALVRSQMLPKGFSDVINTENYKQAKNFFPGPDFIPANMSKEHFRSLVRKKFTSAVLQRKDYHTDDKYSIEVINDGCRFARLLQALVKENRWEHEEKWEYLSNVWMEMMVHAASQCPWKEHAQQLRRGGELLTHLALLMAHFGLTTQIHMLKKEDDIQLPFSP